MLATLTLINIGFSLVASLILLSVYIFFILNLNKSWLALASCTVLLLGLCFLQWGHLNFLLENQKAFASFYYRLAIFTVPSSFFYFSRAILFPNLKLKPLHAVHLVPLAFVFSTRHDLMIVISFMLGFTYCVWLTSILYRLRKFRKRFKEEFFFFSVFSLVAIVILVLGVISSISHTNAFYYVYANSIAFCFALVICVLLAFPSLVEELNEVIALGYVNSTLAHIDVEAKATQLREAMEIQRQYQNENLNLTNLADCLGMSSHQLSELINTRFGLNFSRFIRNQRIEEAKQLLLLENEVSILSISMQVGFKSQSSFYAAFKEVTGISPGQYRIQQLSGAV